MVSPLSQCAFANAQFAETGTPNMRALDRAAIPSELFLFFLRPDERYVL